MTFDVGQEPYTTEKSGDKEIVEDNHGIDPAELRYIVEEKQER